VVTTEATQLGAQLDENHTPETNGRMAVCRRCGVRTDPADSTRHMPGAAEIDRSNRWLATDSHMAHVARVRASQGN